jgi:hypothetical protein
MKKVVLLSLAFLSLHCWGQGESGIEWNLGIIQPGVISSETPTIINRVDAQVIIEDKFGVDAMMNLPVLRQLDFERQRSEYLLDVAHATAEARLAVSTIPWTLEKSYNFDANTEEARIHDRFYDQKRVFHRIQIDGGVNYFQSALTEDISVVIRPSSIPGLGNSITERTFLANKWVVNTHIGISYVWNVDFINRPKGKDVVKNTSHRYYAHLLFNTNNDWVAFERTEEFRNENGSRKEIVTIEELQDVEDIESTIFKDNFGFRLGCRIFSRKDEVKFLNYSFLNIEIMRCPLPGLSYGNQTIVQAALGFGIGSKR